MERIKDLKNFRNPPYKNQMNKMINIHTHIETWGNLIVISTVWVCALDGMGHY